MDPKLAYWTGAFLVLLAAVVLAHLGVRRIRRRELRAHRRLMLTAASLVGLHSWVEMSSGRVIGRAPRAKEEPCT